MAKIKKTEDSVIGRTWLVPFERLGSIDKDIEKLKAWAFEKMDKETLQDCMQVFDEKSFWPTDPRDFMNTLRPYAVDDNGVLTIPVDGTLMGGAVNIRLGGLITGHDYIKQAVKRGMADEDVRAIAFNINSPGGSILGNFELTDFLTKQRGKKPMMSFVEGLCCSAAYNIAAAIGPIAVSVGSEVGSVGVYTIHVDESEAIKKAGYKIKIISAGKGKTDGNPYEGLSTEAEKSIKDRIDGLYSKFVLRVATNRGISEKAVIELGAKCFNADKSIEVGFTDKTGDLDEIRAEFIENITTKKKDEEMTKPDAKEPVAHADHLEAVQTARDEGKAEGKAEGITAGKKEMQERYAEVMASPEYAGREEQALDMLASEDYAAVPTTALIATLGKGAKPTAEKTTESGDGTHGLDAAMKKEETPKVNPDTPADHDTGASASDATNQSDIDAIVAAGGGQATGAGQATGDGQPTT